MMDFKEKYWDKEGHKGYCYAMKVIDGILDNIIEDYKKNGIVDDDFIYEFNLITKTPDKLRFFALSCKKYAKAVNEFIKQHS